MKILFLHGWGSTPGGVKPTFLRTNGHEVCNPHLPDDDFEAAVHIAQAHFDQQRPEVVVGSSRGGAVAMNLDTGAAYGGKLTVAIWEGEDPEPRFRQWP